VAIYCRVSTADQNCDRQENELLAYADRADYEIVGVFKETASGAKNDRKERESVLKLARQRLIDIVLIHELTRWGRSTQDLIHTINELFSRDVSLIPLNGMSFDLNTPMGKLLLTIIAGVSEFERDLLRERIKSGVASAKAKGKHLGRPVGSSKYNRYLKIVSELKEKRTSVRDIAKQLKLSPTTVQKILREIKENENK
jgi:DNA invertase Pin-like site-specific DNA recombinase